MFPAWWKKTRCGVDNPNLQNMKNKYLLYYGQIGQVKRDIAVQIIWRTTFALFQNIDEYLYVFGIIDHKLIWRQYPKFQQQQKKAFHNT